jgi:hypothetical protein
MVATAVCPHPPLLVPALAAGAAPDLEDLRQSCDTAVRTLLATEPDALVVVGPGQAHRAWDAGSTGSFAAYGRDVRVTLGDGESPTTLSDLSMLVGAWLLDHSLDPQVAEPPSDRRTACSGLTVPADLPTGGCVAAGRELADRPGRVALLVMGDGSARRAMREPGAPDPEADAFDAAAARALASGDPAAVLALDADRAAAVAAEGRAAWQVMAGAALGRAWRAELAYDAAPAEVRYLVATWTPA